MRGNPSMVFLDECDTMLVSRAKLGHSSLWMLEPINALLREIGVYPGLVVLATNQKPDYLDHALARRLIGELHFDMPDFLTRVKLWESKWPRKLPVKLRDEDMAALAQFPMTGSEIETSIINWVSDTLRRDKHFSMDDLKSMIFTGKNLNLAKRVDVEKELTSNE